MRLDAGKMGIRDVTEEVDRYSRRLGREADLLG